VPPLKTKIGWLGAAKEVLKVAGRLSVPAPGMPLPSTTQLVRPGALSPIQLNVPVTSRRPLLTSSKPRPSKTPLSMRTPIETRPSEVVPPLIISAPRALAPPRMPMPNHMSGDPVTRPPLTMKRSVPAPLARSRQRSFDPPPPRIFRVPP